MHFPFCVSKCPYCNFSSITGAEGLIERYTNAVAVELDSRLTESYSAFPKTIYIGGGTPSIVSPEYIKKEVRRLISKDLIEYTVEANPESINGKWLDGILESGANRISIGIQSLDEKLLGNLGRIHTAENAVSSVKMAKNSGFTDISVDLMFGIPGQKMKTWELTLEGILELQPDHVSCYALDIEEDSEYCEILKRGDIKIPDPDETADMYLLMAEMLEKGGLVQYEISNFARIGKECKHNQGYWNFTPFLGIGASAHSYDGKMRRWNENNPNEYINKIENKNDPTAGFEILNEEKRLVEMIMLSLRTKKGLSFENLNSLSSKKKILLEHKIAKFEESSFIENNIEGNMCLTAKGAAIANDIISDILADIL